MSIFRSSCIYGEFRVGEFSYVTNALSRFQLLRLQRINKAWELKNGIIGTCITRNARHWTSFCITFQRDNTIRQTLFGNSDYDDQDEVHITRSDSRYTRKQADSEEEVNIFDHLKRFFFQHWSGPWHDWQESSQRRLYIWPSVGPREPLLTRLM